jgi:hypothetical protein
MFGNIIKSFDKSLVIVTQAKKCSQQANIWWLEELMKWSQPLPFEPPIHQDKSCDPSTWHEYEKIDTCQDVI